MKIKKLSKDAIVVSKEKVKEAIDAVKSADRNAVIICACSAIVVVGCTFLTIATIKKIRQMKEDLAEVDFDFDDAEFDI